MKTVRIKTNIDNYSRQYPHYSGEFNEFEKLFWAVGQEIQSLKYLHKLYVDSYAILEKPTYLVDSESATRGGTSESGHRLGIYNLLMSFAPKKGFQSVDSLEFYWNLFFLTAVTPEGLKNFLRFIVADYIVSRDIDVAYLQSDESLSRLRRIDLMLPKVNAFIYEWSSSEEIQVGSYYFFPGSLPFMSIHILIGIHEDTFIYVNSAELVKHLYNQLREYEVSKLTPTLRIETINIVEDWENG